MSLVLRDAKLEVAFFTPVGSPGVTNFPVLWALVLVILNVLAIANDGNSMINSGGIWVAASAIFFSKNTTMIRHQTSGVRVHGNTNWLFSNEGFKSIN